MSVMRQPRHRRPSWMQTASSHRIYLEADFVRKHTSTMASESDSISYDPKFLRTWQLPINFSSSLPARLTKELEDWQTRGAVILTGLDRIEQLDRESIYRGWPIKQYTHLSSNAPQVATEAHTPSMLSSPPDSFCAGSPTANGYLPRLYTTSKEHPVKLVHATAVLDTPPFTPEDIKSGARSFTGVTARDPIDALQLTDRLSPIARRDSAEAVPSSQDSNAPHFDEAAWEVFIGEYNAEVSTLQIDEIVRFRHGRRAIDKLWAEVARDNAQALSSPDKERFVSWWNMMGEKTRELDNEVRKLEPPKLEEIKKDRLVEGLHV